jgi:hypothetical protein
MQDAAAFYYWCAIAFIKVFEFNSSRVERLRHNTVREKLGGMKGETRFGQAEMKSTISVFQENLEAAVHSVWGTAKQDNAYQ